MTSVLNIEAINVLIFVTNRNQFLSFWDWNYYVALINHGWSNVYELGVVLNNARKLCKV